VRVAEGTTGQLEWEVRKTTESDGSVLIQDTRAQMSERWYVRKKTLVPPEGVEGKVRVEETEIAVAIAPGRAKETRTEPVYCWLPTRKQAGTPFLLQADFTPTLGRENVKEDAWDDWLFGQLGLLAAEAVAAS